ncbi:MAG: prephenate dehydratase [Gammaproteobacteria bacterium]|nr:prephenate dehydratase [Gammaproteobacteria bacterium]
MNNEEQRLRELRTKIDAIDEKIQALISKRAQYAQVVAKTKHDNGATHCYRPEREANVLRGVLERNKGPLPNEEMARLFREIMSACLALESPLKIAFLGPAGTFTQEAAFKHFGHSVETVPLGTIDEVFREVDSGDAHFGVVPVENSTEGVVNHTLDMFLVSSLKICGEVALRVHQHLLGRGDSLEKSQRIVSHQQSLAQCREWLDAHLPQLERVPVASNAEAARLAAADDTTLAIASESAAKLYGLNVLSKNIEDRPDNTTRFLVIGNLETTPTGKDKTTLMLSGKNQPGALHKLLTPLSRYGLNMTRIESRPSRRSAWEYVFFIDIEGHVREKKTERVLKLLEREAAFYKCLGSYPKAVR